jgi:p-aminobenzoyl-glutamate transporter AbgT
LFGWLYGELKGSSSTLLDRSILNYFWWVPSLVSLIVVILNLSLTKLMFKPRLKQKEDEQHQRELQDKAARLTRVTSNNVKQDTDAPTEEEMLEFGRFALTMFHERNYTFRTHKQYVRTPVQPMLHDASHFGLAAIQSLFYHPTTPMKAQIHTKITSLL